MKFESLGCNSNIPLLSYPLGLGGEWDLIEENQKDRREKT